MDPKDFNTYGARRGNDEVMVRGTFANTRIKNKMLNGKVFYIFYWKKECPHTVFVPNNEILPIYDAAARYLELGA